MQAPTAGAIVFEVHFHDVPAPVPRPPPPARVEQDEGAAAQVPAAGGSAKEASAEPAAGGARAAGGGNATAAAPDVLDAADVRDGGASLLVELSVAVTALRRVSPQCDHCRWRISVLWHRVCE